MFVCLDVCAEYMYVRRVLCVIALLGACMKIMKLQLYGHVKVKL